MVSLNLLVKRCYKCERVLQVRAFYRHSGSRFYQSYCIPCFKVQSKADGSGHYQRNKSRRLSQSREYRWKKQGATPDDVSRALLEQDGKCAICTVPFSEGRTPRVDHNHSTGKFRGLLCHWCNIGIGLLQDSPNILDRAKAYLVKHETQSFR